MSPAPPPGDARPIVVIKKRVAGHGGHHGGAWKVAYADFVTALMALFIVLWLMSADKEVQQAVSAYFNNPTGPGKLTGTAAAGRGNAVELSKNDMSKLLEKIQQALTSVPNFRDLKDHVEITITSDGLRIEMLETEAGMFFESGKAVPTESGTELLTRLAEELGKLPNHILIEGHTDSLPFAGAGGYTNWELSADRANSARKLMQAHGLGAEQVAQVRGFADRQLRHPEDPTHASNRRISVIVQYLEGTPAPAADPAPGPQGTPAPAAAPPGKPAPAPAADPPGRSAPAPAAAPSGKPAPAPAAATPGKPAPAPAAAPPGKPTPAPASAPPRK